MRHYLIAMTILTLTACATWTGYWARSYTNEHEVKNTTEGERAAMATVVAAGTAIDYALSESEDKPVPEVGHCQIKSGNSFQPCASLTLKFRDGKENTVSVRTQPNGQFRSPANVKLKSVDLHSSAYKVTQAKVIKGKEENQLLVEITENKQ